MKKGDPITPSLWIEIIAESSKNEEVNRYYLSADVAMREALKNIIKTGIDNGEFQAACTEEMSILIFAILDGLIARRAVDSNFNIEQSLPSFQSSLSGILNPGDT